MLKGLLNKVFGTRHEREARKVQPIVDEINEIADSLQSLSEEEFKDQTNKLRGIIHERTGELEAELAELRKTKRDTEEAAEREVIQQDIVRTEDQLKELLQDTLDEILPEAFATVKEACR